MIDDPRGDGYIELARVNLGPHRQHGGRREGSGHARDVLDAAVGYKLAVEVRKDETAERYLERLRDLVA